MDLNTFLFFGILSAFVVGVIVNLFTGIISNKSKKTKIVVSLFCCAILVSVAVNFTKPKAPQPDNMPPKDIIKPLKAIIDEPESGIKIVKGEEVLLIGEVEGGEPPLSYKWDLDGNPPPNISQKAPGFTKFREVGFYKVKFSVTDNNDIDTETVNIIVDYSDEANTLFAKIANPANKSEIERGEKLVFKGDAAGGTPPYTYLWDFDDKSINLMSDQNPGEVRFHNIGSYKVKLIVTDSNNKTSNDELIVCVSNEDCKVDPPKGLSISSNN